MVNNEQSGCLDLSTENDISEITNNEYAKNNTIKVVKLNSSIKKIGIGAFAECKNLETLEGIDGITEIKSCAFQGCNNLNTETVNKLLIHITKIESDTFHSCISITDLKIPDNIDEIEERAFENCINITTLSIGKNVKKIGKCAFSRVDDTDIELADGFTDIKRTKLLKVCYIYSNTFLDICFGRYPPLKLYVLPALVDKYRKKYKNIPGECIQPIPEDDNK